MNGKIGRLLEQQQTSDTVSLWKSLKIRVKKLLSDLTKFAIELTKVSAFKSDH